MAELNGESETSVSVLRCFGGSVVGGERVAEEVGQLTEVGFFDCARFVRQR